MEQGVHSFVHCIMLHAGDWRETYIAQEALAFVQKPILTLTHRHSGFLAAKNSMVEISSQQVVLTTMKPAECGDGYIIRCLEVNGQEANIRIDFPFLQRMISAHFRPCEIKMYHIPSDAAKAIVQVNLLEEPILEALHR